MDYSTARKLLKELSHCWIWEADKYKRRIPDYLLSETLSHYHQACNVLRRDPKNGDFERVALAQMQLKDFDDIEGGKELGKLLSRLDNAH